MKYKKLTLVFLVILLILVLFSPSQYAVINAWGKQFPDFPENFKDYNNNKCVVINYCSERSTYYLYFCDSAIYEYSSKFSNYGMQYYSCYIYKWNPDTDLTWTTQDAGYYDILYERADYFDTGFLEMVYSNKTIENEETGSHFFYQTPLTTFSNWQSTIGGQVWQTVIYLVVTILVVVVSYLGLRKGLKILSALLHQA